jgi:hypothetical protein
LEQGERGGTIARCQAALEMAKPKADRAGGFGSCLAKACAQSRCASSLACFAGDGKPRNSR